MNLQNDSNFLQESDDTPKMVIYQLLPRLFTNTNSNNKKWGSRAENGSGKFNEITKKGLIALKELGATHIWYTGILEHATMSDYTEYGISLDDADVVKGRAGSPYAVKDYYDVDPDLAVNVKKRMQEFESLVERTHSVGLKVIIDFVPNHVARFYESDQKVKGAEDFGHKDDITLAFHPQNNFYYLPDTAFEVPRGIEPLGPSEKGPQQDGHFLESPAKATGNDVFKSNPSANDWYETIKLNYGVDYLDEHKTHFEPIPDTWKKMKHVLNFWAAKGIDGFRCDMAEMVPAAFWNWVIPQIKASYPDLLFIAEIYNQNQYRHYLEFGKFDFLYDKVQLYDTLKKIAQGHGSTHWLGGIWRHLKGINKNMLRFLENHDEQRIASPDFLGDPKLAKPAMFLSATWHTSPVMIYFGQEVGEPGAGESGFSGDDGRTTIFDYWGVPEHQKWLNQGQFDGGSLKPAQQALRFFYQQLLNFVKASPAIAQGAFYDLQEVNMHQQGYTDKVYSFLRFNQDQRLLLICNFDWYQSAHFNLILPEIILSNLEIGPTSKLRGIFGTHEILTHEQGLNIKIRPLDCLIFEF